MATDPNEYHLVFFDPGGTTGWAHFVVDCHAFSRPEAKVMRWLKFWNCGEFTGPELDQCQSAVDLIKSARVGPMPFMSKTNVGSRIDIGSEDFELTQMVGGQNLLSPVRINAVLAWECSKLGLTLKLHKRHLRTSVTRERLKAFGFEGKFRKDEFAAMQHGVTWLRRVKEQSRRVPWKLSDGVSSNAYWDCRCTRGRRCDISHPR